MNQRSIRLPALLLFLAVVSPAFSVNLAPAPSTERRPVFDEYHGVKVEDDYRWLENAADPAVKAWADAQNRRTRAYLDSLPDRAAIATKLTALYAKETPSYGDIIARPGKLFALKAQPPKQQAMIVTLNSADDLDSEKVLLDPNELEPKGNVSIDWYVPSPDGQIVAVCLSKNGSEDGVLQFYRTETGEALEDAIPRVQYPTGGGSVAWGLDGKSVYYTRYPHKDERPDEDANFYQQIYEHKLGEPVDSDVYSLGKDFPRIAEIELATSRGGRWLLASVANGDGGEFAHYVRDLGAGDSGEWRQITKFEDGVKEAVLDAHSPVVYLRSVKDAPRGKILSLRIEPPATLDDATQIVPQGDAVIEGMATTYNFLFVADLVGGPSRLRRFALDGKDSIELPIPANSGVGGIVPLREQSEDDRILFHETSYVEPAAWYSYGPKEAAGPDLTKNGGAASELTPAPLHVPPGVVKKTALAKTSPVDFSDIEAVREFVTSKDGTKVPINILRRKNVKHLGNYPTLLSAYGGYGISQRPGFDFTRRLWFDKGGIIVIANVRGGGEYGEAWHLGGNLTRKQNVFDDFGACALHLIQRGYTTADKIAVEGGSNGGLLMGAFLTQHPGMARAVVSHVGIYDMLRVEVEPNGAFNVTEFGTVKEPAQFKALYAYSPYHHVLDGTKYPAVLFLTGENDGRVNPANSRKMTARLQAATGSSRPILLRQSSGSGHGMGTSLSDRIAQKADVFAFLFDQLGMR